MIHILAYSFMLTFFVMQVRIQKDSEVRLKIVGTRVDATEIVSPSLTVVDVELFGGVCRLELR